MALDTAFLKNDYRKVRDVANMLHTSPQAMYASLQMQKDRGGWKLAKHKVAFRALTNLNDELIQALLDDDNFDEYHRLKANVKFPAVIPPTPATYGTGALIEAIGELLDDETLECQHHKMICTIHKGTHLTCGVKVQLLEGELVSVANRFQRYCQRYGSPYVRLTAKHSKATGVIIGVSFDSSTLPSEIHKTPRQLVQLLNALITMLRDTALTEVCK